MTACIASSIDAAAIFVGIILGSGIFEAPAAVARATPSLPLAAGLWLVGAMVAACGAFCYAECGARLPKTGGFYVYFRETYGEGAAFVAGWAALLITYPVSLAAIAHILARYLGRVSPFLTASEMSTALLAAVAVLVAGGLNIVGVRTGANTQRLLTGFKVLALALLCIAAAFAPGQGMEASSTTSPVELEILPLGLSAMLGAMVLLLWTYDGWSDVTLIGGELRDPGRNFGRTVILGTCVLATLYVLVQTAVMLLLPAHEAAESEQVVADAVSRGLGMEMGRGVAVLVVICTFGAINGVVLTASRLGFAMANDGVFLRFFAAVDPRLGTPARSILALIVATLVYVFMVDDFNSLLGFFSFNVWLFYAATAIALVVLRRRHVGDPPAWRAPGGYLAPAVILITAASMTTSLMVQSPLRSLAGLAILLCGVPAYMIWRRAARRRSLPD
ncbi:APC family permease [Myxococcota bacterium]